MPAFHLGHECPFSKVMCGLDRNGLPIGLQIGGKPWDDVDSGHQSQVEDDDSRAAAEKCAGPRFVPHVGWKDDDALS